MNSELIKEELEEVIEELNELQNGIAFASLAAAPRALFQMQIDKLQDIYEGMQ